MNSLTIRKMSLIDVYAVFKIEKESYNRPWPIMEFIKELNENAYARYFVYLLNKKIIGFLGMWIIIDDAHITNIAISKKFRRKGYGSDLMDFAENYARESNAKKLILEVRVSNISAINLYEKKGFKFISVRKNYYSDNFEDAHMMIKDLN
jgi:[ribosomal protein S18]-alanine N-acetyltransferase